MTDLTLAPEFAVTTHPQWRKLVTSALKGVDLEERLVARTIDGLRVEPLYPKATPVVQPWRGRPGRWRIAQRVDHPTAGAC
jgi:methylmalonyl-CoA mutase